MTLTLSVYENDNTTAVDTIDAGEWRSAEFAEVSSAAGKGKLVIPHLLAAGAANPALALLTTGRVIRFLIDGTPRFAMLVEDRQVEVVAPDEEAGQVTVVNGRGLLAATAKVAIRPDAGTGNLPWYPTRWFNFSADRLRDDDPDGPQGAWPFSFGQLPNYDTNNYFGRPEGFTDTAGPAGAGPHWLWEDDTRTAFTTGGKNYFRQRFTVASTQDVIFEFAVDDIGELWCDGVPVCRVEGVYMGGSVRSSARLSAGSHILASWGESLNEQRAGVVYAVWSVSNGLPDMLLARSDAALARCLGFPTSPPGFTPTETIRLVVDESQNLTPARLPHVTFSFISASDTRHAELTEVTDLATSAPASSIYTLIEQLGASYLDIGVDYSHDGLRLDAWIRGTRGIDRSAYIVFEKGNCRRVAWDIGGSERATVALVTGSGFAPFVRTHADAATTGVYEEVSLDFGDASRTAAARYADEYLNLVSKARKGVTLEILPTGEETTNVTQNGTNVTQNGVQVTVGASSVPRPYADFQIGDTITVPGEDGSPSQHRVAAIGATVGPDSVTRWEVDLEHPRALITERLDAIMRRQLPGSAGGRTILPARTDPSFPSQEAGREQTETWSADQTGTVVLRKNGVAIPGASLSGAGKVTLTDPARKYVAESDVIDFTIGGVAGFPAGWKPPSGRWLQEFAVATTGGAGTGVTITVRYA